MQKKKDEKISSLTSENAAVKEKYDMLLVEHNTLTISNKNVQQDLEKFKLDYSNAVDKLHQMNKARHSLEVKLVDEIEKVK